MSGSGLACGRVPHCLLKGQSLTPPRFHLNSRVSAPGTRPRPRWSAPIIADCGCPKSGQSSRPPCFVGCGMFCFPTGHSGPIQSTWPFPPARRFLRDSSLQSGHAAMCHQIGPSGHPYPFPISFMLYQVKLQYGFLVDAVSRDAAYATAIRLLREAPQSYVSDIHQAGELKKPETFVHRIITGH